MAAEFSEDTVRRMLRIVDPDAAVRAATPVEDGASTVFRLDVEVRGGHREWYLKASPDGMWGVSADARVLSTVGSHTSIPVPEVIGVVDEHEEVPAPYYVMKSMSGAQLGYEEVGWVSDDVLRTVARQLGAHLGELHSVDAGSSFGQVGHDDSRSLAGGRPSEAVADLGLSESFDSWPSYLRAIVDRELDRVADSPFAALTPRLRSWCDDRIDALSGPFSPALGRNDHGFHNLLVDPDTGEITAMIDWAYTLVVPPAYDVAFATYIFGGGFLAGHPVGRDRRELVRTSMLEGYRSTAPELADAAAERRPLYELLAAARLMKHFDQLTPHLPDDRDEAVADGIRRDVERLLETE